MKHNCALVLDWIRQSTVQTVEVFSLASVRLVFKLNHSYLVLDSVVSSTP
jgi:hypothetical protein